jgi:asparagine synthase (glutamine-hydrolysing)
MSLRGDVRASSDVDGARGGPSQAFCRVRLGPEGPVMTGTPSWRGGTPVPRADGETDGVFAGWDYDDGVVRVVIDRLAFFPLYYAAGPTEFCVSPSLVTLLEQGAPRDVDDDALAVFLRTGWFLRDDTAFTAIRAVPPSPRFEWDRGTLTIERATRPHHEIEITRADAMDRYIELFRAAVARRLVPDDEPFVMPLSGGADSRHILLELVRQGRPPASVVTGTQRPRCPDVAAARVLTERLGIPHTVVQGAMDAGWSEELRKNVETNFCADEHVWYLPVADHLLRSTSVSYDGIAGDILSANVDLTEPVLRGMRAGRIAELLDDVTHENHREDVLRDALTPEFYARVPEAVARERIAEELRGHLDASNPWSSFHFDNWDRREITLNAHATLAAIHVHVPFLDRDLVDFLTSLPAELLLGGRFHLDTIRTAYPDVADVPFAKELPRSKALNLVDRVRRTPAHLVLHTRAHVGPNPRRPASSAWLRAVPPVVRHPGRPGSLGTFNRRAAWLRQIEMLASGTLSLP